MLTGYTIASAALTKVTVNQYADLKPEMVWLDLPIRPSRNASGSSRPIPRSSSSWRSWAKSKPARLSQPRAQNVEANNEILRDVESLTTHSGFLADRAKFLMDAAMGIINISFNRRLNIFTVLSVILMPPTLIASIYGMNFRHMPELDWYYG